MVLPCCQSTGRNDAGGMEGWLDSDLAIDVTRAARLRSHGYSVHTQRISRVNHPRRTDCCSAIRVRRLRSLTRWLACDPKRSHRNAAELGCALDARCVKTGQSVAGLWGTAWTRAWGGWGPDHFLPGRKSGYTKNLC